MGRGGAHECAVEGGQKGEEGPHGEDHGDDVESLCLLTRVRQKGKASCDVVSVLPQQPDR